MKIPLLDLKAQYQSIRTEVRQAIDEVLDSQQFILGPTVKRFEEEAASYLQCGAAIGVASGSDALLLSLMALGIGAGDAFWCRRLPFSPPCRRLRASGQFLSSSTSTPRAA
ncbi:MAG: DegT/DnrJ/EryC1/StrS family aminotransferase [Candidatus Binatota bacterium]